MPNNRSLAPWALALLIAACDNGTRVEIGDKLPPGKLTVAVSAGAPVIGASIEVFAVDPLTGAVLSNRPDKGLLGTGGPTDEAGLAVVELSGAFTGVVRVVASGSMRYTDPTDGTTLITLPHTLQLSSFLARYNHGSSYTVPVTLLTTLADAAGLAYAQGRNPASPQTRKLPDALGVTDTLFARHIDPTATWSIRSVVPAPLTAADSLRDSVHVAFLDVAFNQLARSLATQGGVTPGQAITAPTLVADLISDLQADGVFNGTGVNGQLATAGEPAYLLTPETTRGDLARALDAFVEGAANRSGIRRADLKSAGIYDTIALDMSRLYPADVEPPPFVLEPPAGTVTVLAWAGAPVRGASLQLVALDANTGSPLTSIANGGVLGQAGPTDSFGRAVITPTVVYSGPVQIIASGEMSWTDPSRAESVSPPTSLRLSSIVADYRHGSSYTVPVTLWTTLADAAGLAYALGRNPTSPQAKPLAAALAVTDPLFERHVDPEESWSLRSTVPGQLRLPLEPRGLASLPDTALNQLSLELALQGSLDDFNAGSLVLDLLADLAADGQFNGRGASGATLATAGEPPYSYRAITTRADMAGALDNWILGPRNVTGVGRSNLEAAGVYTAIALDTSPLYPASEVPPPFSLEKTPPVITVLEAPAWTNQPSATIRVSAVDKSGTGIKAVYGRVGSNAPTAATLDGDSWTLVVVGNEPVDVVIWGVDNAGNSGADKPAPAQISVRVGFDRVLPRVLLQPSQYFSEQGLTLSAAAVPASYVYAGGSKIALAPEVPIKKASTRVDLGATLPTPAELEGANANNTPFLKFAIDYAPGSDAPISSVTYEVTTSAPGVQYPPDQPPAGALALDETTVNTGVLAYYLPLGRETLFPAWMGRVDDATPNTSLKFRVTITATDAAGNTTTATFPSAGDYTFQLVAAPLHFAEDTSFSAHPRSANSLKLSNTTYHSVFGAEVLYARYVVSNPAPVPVAVVLDAGTSSWMVSETWNQKVNALPQNLVHSISGRTYRGQQWFLYGQSPWDGWFSDPEAWPCTSYMCTAASCYHTFVDPASPSPYGRYYCRQNALLPNPSAALPAWEESSDRNRPLSPIPFQWDAVVAYETTRATAEADGSFIVPAAAASQPGRLAIYVVGRRARPTTMRVLPLQNWTWLGPPIYATWHSDYWVLDGPEETHGRDTGAPYREHRHYSQLDEAREVISFSFPYLASIAAPGLAFFPTPAAAPLSTQERTISHQ